MPHSIAYDSRRELNCHLHSPEDPELNDDMSLHTEDPRQKGSKKWDTGRGISFLEQGGSLHFNTALPRAAEPQQSLQMGQLRASNGETLGRKGRDTG